MNTATNKNGYQYLKELCSFEADFNAHNPQSNPSNRVLYIAYQLNALGIHYHLDFYNAKGYNKEITDQNEPKLVNIVVNFQAENNPDKNTVIFLAHHDIANSKSENCNDNTASVANLIDLCGKLNLIKNTLTNDVCIVFTDAEETVNFSRCGSGYLAKQIKEGKYGNVLYAVNLELTAYGDVIWMDFDNNPYVVAHNLISGLSEKLKKEIPEILPTRTPFNDGAVLRHFGIDSVCIGTLPKKEVESNKYFYPTWALCHRMDDKFENAVEADMNNFVDKLLLLI